MLKALAILLLLPIDAVPRQPADSWVTVTAVVLLVSSHANKAYAAHWSGIIESGPIEMPAMLSNWACKRGGRDKGNEINNYVECRSGDATVVIDVSCKKREADEDLATAILLNKARNYGGRFIITCVTATEPASRPQ